MDRTADVGGILLRQARDQVVTRRNLPSACGLHPLQRPQPDGGAQRVEVQLAHRRGGRVERVKRRGHLRRNSIERMFEEYLIGCMRAAIENASVVDKHPTVDESGPV